MDSDGSDGSASASSSAAGAIERARAALRRLLGEAAAGAMADGHLPDLVRICQAVEGRAGVEAEDLSDAVERAVKKSRADRLRYLRGVVRGRLAQRAGLPASSWLEYERLVAAIRLPEDWLARVMAGLGAKPGERGSGGGATERGRNAEGQGLPTPDQRSEVRSMMAEALATLKGITVEAARQILDRENRRLSRAKS